MLKIKHPYQLQPYEKSEDCPESNQLHFIIMSEINCNSLYNIDYGE